MSTGPKTAPYKSGSTEKTSKKPALAPASSAGRQESQKRKNAEHVEDAPEEPKKLKKAKVEKEQSKLQRTVKKGKEKAVENSVTEPPETEAAKGKAQEPMKKSKGGEKVTPSLAGSAKGGKSSSVTTSPKTKQSTSNAQAKPKPALISHEGAKPKSLIKAAVKAVATTKKAKKAKSPSPAPSESDDELSLADDEEDEGDEHEEADGQSSDEGDDEDDSDDVHLHGFSSDDNSSDEELEDGIGLDVSKLPTIAKDDEAVKLKLEKAKREANQDRGVIYLGRIPHGFYEDQMRAYFSQFGEITRLRLSRNKKTGRSKHYAFIEFDSSSVAQIVAETMDNYLLMGHILRCKVIPKDEVDPHLWIGANRKWRRVPRDPVARVKHNKPRTEEEQEKAENRLIKRQETIKRKLQEVGIDYDFSPVAYKKRTKAVET
ncbi:hypothetical protein PUNSTDRAFT_120238 [Punctularia strigosozonata HHB-11173 SS5]|uniref:uncharacterized protein n=1 Tax=Punctularia strigosozonata (strain HHB-11173) TaxID=741275 RepID=UPI0004418488|nr:uncharacterized protein PUNSTDRAFT_120238 [Punctularia strigosozonata HHB-11173 SS5]EIN10017.1 hypothetical protein PUNSTDRAFT_120238 [Punctularia strigosozonata HHB-11173 SS5]